MGITSGTRAGTSSLPVERIGHRGAPRELLENTLPSFERALERGADAIELDVHTSSDGVVVVHHDATLERVADSSYQGRALNELPWSALRGLALAPGFSIPTLAEVLDFVQGRARLYVELKGAGIEAAVVEVVRRSRATCALHSFDAGSIARAAVLAPRLRRGILLERLPPDPVATMRAVSAIDLWPDWRIIRPALVDAVHAAGGRVIAWTVNDATNAARLAHIGVDGICSDDVRLLSM
ncbi:MAG TPA: glycerophosphodiester phosphodiesterase [Gemmatimonadaceae bacterium]|nr:glycerophosphodiester phosphodiesterase [Gemmatimonadaceae bacterium]